MSLRQNLKISAENERRLELHHSTIAREIREKMLEKVGEKTRLMKEVMDEEQKLKDDSTRKMVQEELLKKNTEEKEKQEKVVTEIGEKIHRMKTSIDEMKLVSEENMKESERDYNRGCSSTLRGVNERSLGFQTTTLVEAEKRFNSSQNLKISAETLKKNYQQRAASASFETENFSREVDKILPFFEQIRKAERKIADIESRTLLLKENKKRLLEVVAGIIVTIRDMEEEARQHEEKAAEARDRAIIDEEYYHALDDDETSGEEAVSED